MKLTKIAACLLPLCAVGAVLADDDDDVYTGTVQVTATRVAKDLMDVPLAVSVVTADEIKETAPATVADALRDVPGVSVENSSAPGLKRISIRGESTTNTLVLIDGQKVSDQRSPNGVPLLIDPSEVERIEVIKGPASVLYGSDAIGGVVNVITKKGGDKPVSLDVGISYDSGNDGIAEHASMYGRSDGFTYRISGAHGEYGDVHTPEGTARNTDSRSTSGSLYLAYDFTPDVTFGVSANYYDLAANNQGVTSGYDSYTRIRSWEDSKLNVFLEARNLSETLSKIRVDAFVQEVDKDMSTDIIGFSEGPSKSDLTTCGFTVQSEWQLGDSNYLTVGAGVEADELDSDASFVTTMGSAMTYDTTEESTARQQRYYLFLSNETILPWDLTATYGARYTVVHNSGHTAINSQRTLNTGYFSMTTPYSVNENNSDTDQRVVFNAGLVWRGLENTAIRFNWGQGFRAPNSYQISAPYTAHGFSVIYPNPDLDPETSNNFELGLRYDDRALTVDAAVFYNIARNYISMTENAQLLSFLGTANQWQNISKATTYGVELMAEYRFACGAVPYANVTWKERIFEEGDIETTRTGTPRLTARYGLRYNHDFGAWTLKTDLYGRSQTEVKTQSDIGETHAAGDRGGFTTANFAIGAAFGEKRQYSVNAQFLNLLDHTYKENASTYEAGFHALITANATF